MLIASVLCVVCLVVFVVFVCVLGSPMVNLCVLCVLCVCVCVCVCVPCVHVVYCVLNFSVCVDLKLKSFLPLSPFSSISVHKA